jgi:hypothetical protein
MAPASVQPLARTARTARRIARLRAALPRTSSSDPRRERCTASQLLAAVVATSRCSSSAMADHEPRRNRTVRQRPAVPVRRGDDRVGSGPRLHAAIAAVAVECAVNRAEPPDVAGWSNAASPPPAASGLACRAGYRSGCAALSHCSPRTLAWPDSSLRGGRDRLALRAAALRTIAASNPLSAEPPRPLAGCSSRRCAPGESPTGAQRIGAGRPPGADRARRVRRRGMRSRERGSSVSRGAVPPRPDGRRAPIAT